MAWVQAWQGGGQAGQFRSQRGNRGFDRFDFKQNGRVCLDPFDGLSLFEFLQTAFMECYLALQIFIVHMTLPLT